MLTSVTENGFSKPARVNDYYVAGKTGTAQMPTKSGGYTDLETWQTFSGFGPSDNPKFVAIIKFDRPGVNEASVSAAPVFSKLAKYIFDYWQIPSGRDIVENLAP
jgi:cell division protein FtsI/penicillin-binding protein 2